MKKLLSFELFKLRKQKSLYICSAVLLVALFLTILLNYVIYNTFGSFIGDVMEKPGAVSSVLSAANAADFTLIVGIFIALYVCSDFSQHTIKNIYSRGFSRTEVYFSKLIVCVAYTVIMYFITLLFAFILGCAFFGFKYESGHIVALLLGQLITCVAYSCFTFAISYMIKKNGAAIALTIIAPIVITLILSLIDAAIAIDGANSDRLWASDFWLDGISSNLSRAGASVKTIIIGCIIPIAYGGMFVAAGYFVDRYAEV